MKIIAIWIVLVWVVGACSPIRIGTKPTQTSEIIEITPIAPETREPGSTQDGKPHDTRGVESANDSPVITWKRSGGIAGICQQMIIQPDATYQITDCNKGQVLVEGKLESPFKERISALASGYASSEWETPQSELGPDVFQDSLSLHGTGTLQADGNGLDQELASMAQSLIRKR